MVDCDAGLRLPDGTMPRRKRREAECGWCNETYHQRNVNGRFCSTDCFAAHQNAEYLAQWLSGQRTKIDPRSGVIRAHLLERQGGLCALCPSPPLWWGKPLIFVLDHVSGNSEDDSPQNLRLVCPNCDSQLATFKARNRGNGRHARRARYATGKSY